VAYSNARIRRWCSACQYPRRSNTSALSKAGQAVCRHASNGVDTNHFRPAGDPATIRQKFGYAPEAIIVLLSRITGSSKAREKQSPVAQVGNPNLKLVSWVANPEPYGRFAESQGVANQITSPAVCRRVSALPGGGFFRAADTTRFVARCHCSKPRRLVYQSSVRARMRVRAYRKWSRGFVIEDPQDCGALATAMNKMLSADRAGQDEQGLYYARAEI